MKSNMGVERILFLLVQFDQFWPIDWHWQSHPSHFPEDFPCAWQWILQVDSIAHKPNSVGLIFSSEHWQSCASPAFSTLTQIPVFLPIEWQVPAQKLSPKSHRLGKRASSKLKSCSEHLKWNCYKFFSSLNYLHTFFKSTLFSKNDNYWWNNGWTFGWDGTGILFYLWQMLTSIFHLYHKFLHSGLGFYIQHCMQNHQKYSEILLKKQLLN